MKVTASPQVASVQPLSIYSPLPWFSKPFAGGTEIFDASHKRVCVVAFDGGTPERHQANAALITQGVNEYLRAVWANDLTPEQRASLTAFIDLACAPVPPKGVKP